MTLQGIDLSSNNIRPFDFKKLTADVVISKLTGGLSYFWKDNPIQDALNAGKLVGCYHFANENGVITNADEQAQYFYSKYKEYKGKVLPILDYETPINGKYLTQHDMNKVDNFMIAFYKLAHVYPVLYCSKDFVYSTKIPEFTKNHCMLWFAQYANTNTTGYQSNPWTDNHVLDMNILGQQYTANGRVDGIKGYVDLSIFYITKNNWKKCL